MALTIVRLTEPLDPHVARDIDALLETARSVLIEPGAHLEGAHERAEIADMDPDRIVLIGRHQEKVAGLIDARIHVPGPLDLTVCELAVLPTHRFLGIGRTLVRAVIRTAERQAGPLDRLHAWTRPNAHEAKSFWAHLGGEDLGRGHFVLAPDL